MSAEDGGSELLSRVQVVDRASLRFRDFSEARHDNWDIEWEATPPPVDRAPPPTRPPAPVPPSAPSPPPTPARRPTPSRSAIPDVLPEPVYVPAPDATPAAADRHTLGELHLDDLEELEDFEPIEAIEAIEATEPAHHDRLASPTEPHDAPEPDDTFPPLSDPSPMPVHTLHPPGDAAPRQGDDADTWEPPSERHQIPSPTPGQGFGPPAVEPGGYAVPPSVSDGRPRAASSQAVDALPAVFAGLSPRVVEAAVGHFEIFEVKAGTRLISQGEKHPALVMVLGGELVAERAGARRRAQEGDCLGFTTLFGDGLWATTVRALMPSRLLVLDLAGFRALRAQGSVVSVAIEEYALDLLTTGLDRTRQRVAQLATDQPLESFEPKQSFFDRLASAVGMGGVVGTHCDGVRALRASPLFRNAEQAHLEALAQRMEGIKAQAGSYLSKQGEASSAMYLMVSGQVDVLTASREDRAVRHDILGPGELFGSWSMLRDHPSRTTVIARTRCMALELDKLAWAELAPSHTGVGSVLRLAVLRALTARLVRASARLASLEAGHRPQVDATVSGSFVTIDPIDRR